MGRGCTDIRKQRQRRGVGGGKGSGRKRSEERRPLGEASGKEVGAGETQGRQHSPKIKDDKSSIDMYNNDVGKESAINL